MSVARPPCCSTHTPPPDITIKARPAAMSWGIVNETRRPTRAWNGTTAPTRASRGSMPGHKSAEGERAGSAPARDTTSRRSASVSAHSRHDARCASNCARSSGDSSSAMYSESRSFHWSVILVLPYTGPCRPGAEVFSQHHPRAVQLRFRCARRNLEHRRDLVVLVPFHVVQHEDLAGAVRELLERGFEVHAEIARLRGARQRLEDVLAVVQPRPPHLVRPEPLDDDVHGEAVQPRGERGVAPKRPKLLPEADEDVLRELVGVATRRHPPDEAVDARQMRPVEFLESANVTCRGARHVGQGLSGCLLYTSPSPRD